MALTATASDTLISQIIKDTGMINPVIIQVSPDKRNLLFGVQHITSMYETFLPLIVSLKEQRIYFKRTMIFCQRQVDCGQVFQLFQQEMKDELTDPIGAPVSLPQCRLVDVFAKGTEDLVKDTILLQSTVQNSKLRVIICTAAFGMGVNCAGIESVIHFGPPNDVETYIQQTGRSGRDGKVSHCIMLFGKGLSRFCDKQMLEYCHNNSECRRDVLFRDFKSYKCMGRTCFCCDICARKCNCDTCIKNVNNLCL